MQLYMLDIEYGLSTNCAPNDVLITLGNTSVENKELECAIAYNNIESFLSTLIKTI